MDLTNKNGTNCKLFDINADSTETLSYEKKMSMFEDDLETLYESALSKGFSPSQIRSCLSPMLGGEGSFGKRMVMGSWRSVSLLSVLVAIIASVWSTPVAKDMIAIHARLLFVKTIPIYDWSVFWDQFCLIENPFITKVNMTRDDCRPCFEVDGIRNINGSEEELVSEALQADIPFIVNDVTEDWPRDDKNELLFSMEKLGGLFKDERVPTAAAIEADCSFTSNGIYNIKHFVKSLAAGNFPEQFHISWDNCDADAAKVFRLLVKRFSFIPAFASISTNNQIIVARGNYTEEDFALPQAIASASVITVLRGALQVKLEPNPDCTPFNCTEPVSFLSQGVALVVPTRIWSVKYSPISDDYTLAYATTLEWGG